MTADTIRSDTARRTNFSRYQEVYILVGTKKVKLWANGR